MWYITHTETLNKRETIPYLHPIYATLNNGTRGAPFLKMPWGTVQLSCGPALPRICCMPLFRQYSLCIDRLCGLLKVTQNLFSWCSFENALLRLLQYLKTSQSMPSSLSIFTSYVLHHWFTQYIFLLLTCKKLIWVVLFLKLEKCLSSSVSSCQWQN